MKRYFVTSDIHGFYDEFRAALKKAGFRVNNPDHILIICGDIFDRGTQPLQIYKWLKSLPKYRRILVRGNHESLLEQLVKRGYAESHDRHNRTIDTLYQLNGYESEADYTHEMYHEQFAKGISYGTPEYEAFRRNWNVKHRKIFTGIVLEILDWIKSKDWVDYYELDKYIFVHSFIPLKKFYNQEKSLWAGIPVKEKPDEYDSEWRTAKWADWEEATWGCPWKLYKAGYFDEEIKNGKILVCGHWHASDFWNNLEGMQLDTYEDNPIYYSDKNPNLIALDACTAATGGINVLVINGDGSVELYNHNEVGKHVNQ